MRILFGGWPPRQPATRRGSALDHALPRWERFDRIAYADGSLPRTEVLWINPQLCGAMRDGPLSHSGTARRQNHRGGAGIVDELRAPDLAKGRPSMLASRLGGGALVTTLAKASGRCAGKL